MNLTFLYLAAIYLVAVFCWRRLASTPVPWPVATFFYLLVLLFLFKPLTGPYDSVPSDIPLGFYPWIAEYNAGQTKNPEINDVILQLVPWAHQVRESWKKFEAPLWNAAAGAGYPLLGNGQSSPFSPFRLLALPLPLGQSLTLEAALKLLVALTGAYLYMRRRGYSDAAAILTAVSFGFCTFQIVWLHFPLASVAVFLPTLFLAVDLVFFKPTYRRFLFCSLVFLMLLVNGQPEMAAFSVLIAGLYLLWMLVSEERQPGRVRAIATIILAGIVALILALPVLLPFLEALPLSARYSFLEATKAPIARLDPRFLVLFVQPQFYGTMPNRHLWGPGLAEFISGYGGVFAVAAWVAFVVHFVRRRTFRDPLFFFVWVAPLLLWIVMGWPYLAYAFHHLPILSMAAHGRLRLLLCWSIAVLAGAAIDRLLPRERSSLLIGLLAVAGSLLWIFTHNDFPNAQDFEEGFITTVPRIAVLLVGLLALFAARLRVPSAAAAGLLIAVVAFDLLSFAVPWSPVVDARDMYPMTHLLRALHYRYSLRGGETQVEPFRVAATGGTFFPNSAAMYGLEDIRAHDPMASTRSLGALRIFAGYSAGDYFAMLGKVDHPLIDFLNVRFVITNPYDYLPSDHFGMVYSGADGRIYQNLRVRPRFYPVRTVIVQFNDADRMNAILQNRDWEHNAIVKRLPTWLVKKVEGDLFTELPEGTPMAKVTIVRSSAREHVLRIHAPRWTFIASSQPQWPGWRIYQGDEEVKTIETNGLFIGFLAPPGDSEMRMVYHPRSFYMGLYASLLCAGVLLVLLFRRSGHSLLVARCS